MWRFAHANSSRACRYIYALLAYTHTYARATHSNTYTSPPYSHTNACTVYTHIHSRPSYSYTPSDTGLGVGVGRTLHDPSPDVTVGAMP